MRDKREIRRNEGKKVRREAWKKEDGGTEGGKKE